MGGIWVCKPCEDEAECNANPQGICIWGETTNACNRRVCAKVSTNDYENNIKGCLK